MLKNFLLILYFLFAVTTFAQEKSKVTETINGKEYYLHEVKKGQSLYGLSKLYNIDIPTIEEANPTIKNGLKVGSNILIPKVVIIEKFNEHAETTDTTYYKYHTVLKGQTIYFICKQYNISQEQFYIWNPTKKLGLKEGETVVVQEKKIAVSTPIHIDNYVEQVQSKNNNISFEKKHSYTAMCLLPFHTNNLDNILIEDMIKNKQNFPSMSSMMIDFYSGLKFAADSLKSDSFNIHITPVDIKENDTLKITELIHNNTYINADLIIGPVFSNMIKLEQIKTSQNNKCHIIPFINQNKFLFNHLNYSKTTPSAFIDIRNLAQYIADSLQKDEKVIVLFSGINSEYEYVKEFKKYFNTIIQSRSTYKDTAITMRNIATFKTFAKEKEKYVVVFFTNNQVTATDYITKLSIINKTSSIKLVGFYKTATLDNLDAEYLNQMKFIFSHYQNILYSNLYTDFVKKYQEYFNSDPSLYFYEGIQIGLYYFNLIKQYGPGCLQQLDSYPTKNMINFINMEFTHPDASTGFQNDKSFIYQIIDRKIVMKKF